MPTGETEDESVRKKEEERLRSLPIYAMQFVC
jgi:hypothetical protein